jgi:hypothetical protein
MEFLFNNIEEQFKGGGGGRGSGGSRGSSSRSTASSTSGKGGGTAGAGAVVGAAVGAAAVGGGAAAVGGGAAAVGAAAVGAVGASGTAVILPPPPSVNSVLKSSNDRGDHKEYPTFNKPNPNEEKFSKNLREICLYMVINIVFGLIIIITWFMNIEIYYKYIKQIFDRDKTNLNDINYYVESSGGFSHNLNLVPLLIYINIKNSFVKLLLYFNKNEKFDPIILISITVIFIILITFIALSSLGLNNI